MFHILLQVARVNDLQNLVQKSNVLRETEAWRAKFGDPRARVAQLGASNMKHIPPTLFPAGFRHDNPEAAINKT